MIKRAITGIILVAVLGVLIYFNQAIYGLFGLFLAFSLIAGYELIEIYRKNEKKIFKYDLYLYFLIFINFLVISNIFSLPIKVYTILVLISILYSNLTLYIINTFTKDNLLKDKSFFIINYIPFGFGSLIFLRNIESLGFYLLLLLISVVFLTDTFAYIFGRLIGKHKLTKISPKKTWEGSIFGTLHASLTMVFISHFLFRKEINIISKNIGLTSIFQVFIVLFLITLIISIIAQLGDLFASKIKRDYGIKDYGKIFPGHGGVLDRFDSLIFSSFTLFIFVLAYNIIL